MTRSLKFSAATLLGAALLFGSCATKGAAPSKMPAEPAKPAKPSTAVAKVPVLVKETSFYPDGLVDEYVAYKLDATDKNVVEKATFDPARPDPVERAVPEYKDGRLVAESIYDSDSKLRSRRDLGYDASGRLVSERVLDANGKVTSSSAYAYDGQGRKAEWRVLDSSGGIKAVSAYSYDRGALVGVAMKDSGGRLSGSIKMEYADGLLAKRSYLGPDGALQKYESYSYAGGRVTELENRRADASLASKATYEYGPIGELVKSSEFDSSGALKGYSTYEYIVREDSGVPE
jgi:YD repeat-containing protein